MRFIHMRIFSLRIQSWYIRECSVLGCKRFKNGYRRFWSRRIILCKGTIWHQTQVLWRWHNQHAWVSGRQHFRGFCGKVFPADSRYSNGNKLCPSSSRHISLLIWSRIHTVFALNREETVGVSVQFHIQVHRWCFVHKQPRVWGLHGPDVSRWTRDQTQQRATHLLLTWIYFCRSGGTVNFTLPFMTNVTISISTSQIFRSWVAIFQPRPPMACLFRSLYGMPGLAPRMDVLSWGRRDFQISFSNRDTSRTAWNRHWGSFMVDTGILSNNMKFPSHKC